MNFVTHAHGQGYADLNPIIPELIESIDYWKGPFYGQLGNLSTAGAAKFRYFDLLPQGIASITLGEHNFYRGLVADTLDLSNPASASSKSSKVSSSCKQPVQIGPPVGDSSLLSDFFQHRLPDSIGCQFVLTA